MKRITLIVVAMMMAMFCMAQSSLVVTLSNQSKVKVFEGNTALKMALKEASNGDVISLSSGIFLADTITKNITLRGMGLSECTDSANVHGATFITGTMKINISENETGKFRMEGVYLQDSLQILTKLNNPMFEKCRFHRVRCLDNGVLNHANFLHCRIADSFLILENSSVYMSNCIVNSPANASYTGSSFEFSHCIVFCKYSWSMSNEQTYYYFGSVENSIYTNSILIGKGYIPTNCTATYCAGSNLSSNSSIFGDLSETARNTDWNLGYNCIVSSSYSDTDQYTLSDANKAKYIGSDGTEVGIHGGSLPFDENPIRPRILDVTVSKATSSNGYLPVIIHAKDATY